MFCVSLHMFLCNKVLTEFSQIGYFVNAVCGQTQLSVNDTAHRERKEANRQPGGWTDRQTDRQIRQTEGSLALCFKMFHFHDSLAVGDFAESGIQLFNRRNLTIDLNNCGLAALLSGLLLLNTKKHKLNTSIQINFQSTFYKLLSKHSVKVYRVTEFQKSSLYATYPSGQGFFYCCCFPLETRPKNKQMNENCYSQYLVDFFVSNEHKHTRYLSEHAVTLLSFHTAFGLMLILLYDVLTNNYRPKR